MPACKGPLLTCMLCQPHGHAARLFNDPTRKYRTLHVRYVQHFHLSHNYPDSISVVGRCAFVQTGVIGNCNRDGYRQSRLIKGAFLPPAQVVDQPAFLISARL